jgi:hypothetical protein
MTMSLVDDPDETIDCPPVPAGRALRMGLVPVLGLG